MEKGTKGAGTFQRFEIVGQTPHVHEREGIEWLRAALPTYGPFGGYALFSFQTDDGRRYEIDAIALTAHCLYVIEMKSWQGRVTDGDVRHLVTTSARRGREVVDHPLPLLETKTKTFAARVKRVARSLGRDVAAAMDALWFDSLVWLTHADQGTDLGPFDAARAHLVLGKAEIGDALRQARFPGARADLAQRTVTHDTLKQLRKVLQSDAFGLNKIQKPPTVLGGQYELSRLVGEGDDYQDHLATPHHEGPKVRVRSYLAPHTDRAFVEKLERRARREHDLLTRLGDHPDILAVTGFDPAGPLGPAIVFRGFDGKPLDALVKERRAAGGRTDLGLDDKLAILRRVADALTFCHENEVVHGALSPEAVLVAAPPGAPVQVKLTRFALAAAGDPVSDGTRLFTRLAGASASVYEAPELVRGGAPTPASDLFSLAALAYFLLAEEAPAPSAADLARRLDRDGGLLLSAVRDDLFPGAAGQDVDAVLSCATGVDPLLRAQGFCSPREFVDRLEDALTAPAAAQPAAPEAPAPPPDPDPLHAAKGTVLKGGIEVLAELGSGATARVFKVHHPTEDVVALKVPLSETHDDQIAEEWQILRRLGRVAGVDRVARGIEAVTLAGRTCLLVQLAGDRTLADEIRAEGALSLDYARRWGDDLLTALRSLEEAGVQHRDIKPANIGLTSGAEKGKKRLLLFDFSLAHRAATEIGIGTPAYKDPELPVRGRWDDAADRWAAAITIHEMFTGVRPAPAPGAAKGPAVRLAPERFDADVRDGLVRFFERAFQASAADRFATADDMRDAFTRALHKVPEHDARGAAPEPELSPAALSGLGRDAPVAALPLSTRQRNALDRMGIYTLDDLAQLSTNRLGAVRGVGAKTARSLVEIAETVRKHLSISATAPPAPFLRGFGGARRPVEDEAEAGRLSPALARRFAEAGLADAAAVASAPHAHVKNLVQRARKDGAPESARDVTAWLEGLVSAEKPPATLAAAVAALLPSRGAKTPAWLRRTRVFVGLESVPGFPRFGTMSELAAAERVSRAAISIDIGRAREHWLGASRSLPLPSAEPAPVPRGLAALSRAFAAVAAALQASAGVVPLPRAAAAVLEALPPEPDLPPEEAQTSAEAIVRALTEVDAAPLGGPAEARLRLRRDERAGRVLVAWDRAGFDLAEALGELADALVAGARVVAEPEAAASLAEALRGPLASVSGRSAEAAALPERALVALAASTARVARLSARGELYPAGLAAGSALQWSAAAITSRIELDELARRVRARYPDAAPFPEDPAEIEALARSLDLRFDRDQGALLPRERTLALPSGTSAVSLSQGTEPAGPVSLPEPAAEERSGPAAGPASPPAPSPAALASPGAAAAPASAPPAPATSAAPPLPPAYLRKERSESDIRGAAALRVFDEELDRARRDGLFRVLLWRGHPATHDRPSDRGAPDAEHAARAVARRTSGQHLRLDACLLDAAAAVAVEKKIRNGLEPAIEADRLGPSGPAWPRLLDLMRLAAARAVASLPADRPRVLTRLGLLARYDLLSVLAELAAAHRAPAASSGAALPAPRAATFVVLPVFTGEGPVVEVQSDVARAGSLLVQVPGVLRHEILELPSVWLERQAERRSASAPAFPAVRP